MVAGYLADILLQVRVIIWLLLRDISVQILANISSLTFVWREKLRLNCSNWSPVPQLLIRTRCPPATLRQHIRLETDGSKILFCHIKPPWK